MPPPLEKISFKLLISFILIHLFTNVTFFYKNSKYPLKTCMLDFMKQSLIRIKIIDECILLYQIIKKR